MVPAPPLTAPAASLGTRVPRLLTIPEVGQVLRISRSQVYKLIERGELRSIHIGSRHLVPMTEVDGYIDRRLQEPSLN